MVCFSRDTHTLLHVSMRLANHNALKRRPRDENANPCAQLLMHIVFANSSSTMEREHSPLSDAHVLPLCARAVRERAVIFCLLLARRASAISTSRAIILAATIGRTSVHRLAEAAVGVNRADRKRSMSTHRVLQRKAKTRALKIRVAPLRWRSGKRASALRGNPPVAPCES